MNAIAPYQFNVTGMSCQHCVKAVTQAIKSIDPEAVVQVDLPSGKVLVASQATPQALSNAIEQEGYSIVS